MTDASLDYLWSQSMQMLVLLGLGEGWQGQNSQSYVYEKTYCLGQEQGIQLSLHEVWSYEN